MPPPQQPTDAGLSTPETVIEFGAGRPPADHEPPARRRNLTGFVRALAGDHRVAPLAAGLSAVAAFASLISEWQVTTVDAAAITDGAQGIKLLPSDLADLGAFGSGYLAGLFLLAGAVVLAILGPPAGRRYARAAGLGVGGALLGMLISLVPLLGDQSRIFSRLYTIELSPDHLKVGYGRGLWCALAAVVLAMAALYLAGRLHPPAGGTDPDTGDPDQAAWPWRRPRADQEEVVPDAPFDLTVSSAQPFTSRTDDHDQPAG